MEEQEKIDARVIALDETEFYSFMPGDKQYIRQMLGVYLYDKNSHTHCCEISLSYYLIHLYDVCVLNKKGERLTDVQQDRLRDKYENNRGSENSYHHVKIIDQLEEKLNSHYYYIHGDTGVDYEDTNREEQLEALREHFCANCPL